MPAHRPRNASPGRPAVPLRRRGWALLVACLLAFLAPLADARAQDPEAAPDDLVPPALKNEVSIAYPETLAAQADPPAGTVVVKLVVGVDGVPRELEVVESVDPRLDALVLEAAADLRYEPATYRGQKVEVAISVAVALSPPEPAPEAEAEPPPVPSDEVEYELDDGSSDGPVRIQGAVLRAGQRVPVVGARVVAVPADPDARTGPVTRTTYGEEDPEPTTDYDATTDADGRFALRGLPDGKWRLVIVATGYERAEYIEALGPDEQLEVRYFQTAEQSNPYRTVVESRVGREEVSRRTLTIDEVNSLPGNQGDALRSIQTLPGVARPPFGAGLLVIRGAAPFDSSVYVGEHQIPILFHFGALSTAVNADVLSNVEFIPSNYDARWGNAIGGVVSVYPRAGRRDGVHGYVDADIVDASTLVEGPMGKGSFIATFRRSYIDGLLPLVLPADSGIDLIRAPRFMDYAVFLDYPIGPGTLTVRALGGDDRFSFVSAEENEDTDSLQQQTDAVAWFHRADLVYRVDSPRGSFVFTPSFRQEYGKGAQGSAANTFLFETTRSVFSFRSQLDRQISRRLRIEVGAESVVLRNDLQAEFFAGNSVSNGGSITNPAGASADDRQRVDTVFPSGNLAVYGSAVVNDGRPFRIIPGVRAQWFVAPLNRGAVDPRVRFVWDVAERSSLRGGVGLYAQTPAVNEFEPSFGNENLPLYRAAHFSGEFEQGLPSESSLIVAPFFTRMWDLPAPSQEQVSRGPDEPATNENLVATGSGRAYGVEFLLKKNLTRSFVGWISYTVMRSQRRERGSDPWFDYDYDQRHILTALGGFALPKGWRIGARLRFTSGNPFTPYIGSDFDAATGNHFLIEGPRNSARLPNFFQLDLRVDKRWTWNLVTVAAYLDLQNSLNTQSVEFFTYGYDGQDKSAVRGLPILPGFGLRLEW